MISYRETPIQEIISPVVNERGIQLLIKREDLNHPFVSGNKWWKLKYNLEEAKNQGKKRLVTFGGAYSNHIYATAAAASETGFESIGIIRGEETNPLSPTLTFAKSKGMQLHFVSREAYRKKAETDFFDLLINKFGDFYLLPEGGTNELAVKGCMEFAKKILTQADFDAVCLPVGTGGTMAGIVAGLQGEKKIIGFSAMKGGDFLEAEVRKNLKDYCSHEFSNWRIETGFHFGGYGRSTAELENFIVIQNEEHNLPLDRVYTSKMMVGILELICQDYFKPGSKILALHTGGLQGG